MLRGGTTPQHGPRDESQVDIVLGRTGDATAVKVGVLNEVFCGKVEIEFLLVSLSIRRACYFRHAWRTLEHKPRVALARNKHESLKRPMSSAF